MAEKLKEFVNRQFTLADLVDGKYFPLIVNDDKTQAVVRDVQVDEAGTNVSGRLLNNGFRVGGIESLSGLELVDSGNELKFELVPAPVPYDLVKYAFLSNGVSINVVWRAYGNNGYELKGESLSLGDMVLSTPVMTNAAWVFVSDDSAYFFKSDGNDSSTLFKGVISDGNVSAWSSVSNELYSYASFDGVDKIYWVSGRVFNTHDVNTGITGAGVDFGSRLPTGVNGYSRSCVSNGVFFLFLGSSHKGYLYAYNPVLNSLVTIELSLDIVLKDTMKMEVIYDRYSDRYTIICVDLGVFSAQHVDVELNFSQDTDSVVGSDNVRVVTIGGKPFPYISESSLANHKLIDSGDGRFLYAGSDGSINSVNPSDPSDVFNVFPTGTVSNGYSVCSVCQVIRDNPVDGYDIRVTAKISGVEITE